MAQVPGFAPGPGIGSSFNEASIASKHPNQ